MSASIQAQKFLYLPSQGSLIDLRFISKAQLLKFQRDSNGDFIIFDSSLEAKTYQLLRQFDSSTECHKPVLIKPQTKNYPAVFWRCDFYLPSWGVYFESKGYVSKDFPFRLKMLDYVNPDIHNKLFFVVDNPRIKLATNRPLITLSQLTKEINGKRLADRFVCNCG